MTARDRARAVVGCAWATLATSAFALVCARCASEGVLVAVVPGVDAGPAADAMTMGVDADAGVAVDASPEAAVDAGTDAPFDVDVAPIVDTRPV
jgi:hypothetical protein